MAPKSASRVAGGFLNLVELAGDGPVLCVFRLVEFEDPDSGDFGPMAPVIADVLVLDGDQEGEIHSSEKIIGAVANTLRGVAIPKDCKLRDVPDPVNEVGDEILCRIESKPRKGGSPFAVANVPSRSEEKAAKAFYDKYDDNPFEALTGGDRPF